MSLLNRSTICFFAIREVCEHSWRRTPICLKCRVAPQLFVPAAGPAVGGLKTSALQTAFPVVPQMSAPSVVEISYQVAPLLGPLTIEVPGPLHSFQWGQLSVTPASPRPVPILAAISSSNEGATLLFPIESESLLRVAGQTTRPPVGECNDRRRNLSKQVEVRGEQESKSQHLLLFTHIE